MDCTIWGDHGAVREGGARVLLDLELALRGDHCNVPKRGSVRVWVEKVEVDSDVRVSRW